MHSFLHLLLLLLLFVTNIFLSVFLARKNERLLGSLCMRFLYNNALHLKSATINLLDILLGIGLILYTCSITVDLKCTCNVE